MVICNTHWKRCEAWGRGGKSLSHRWACPFSFDSRGALKREMGTLSNRGALALVSCRWTHNLGVLLRVVDDHVMVQPGGWARPSRFDPQHPLILTSFAHRQLQPSLSAGFHNNIYSIWNVYLILYLYRLSMSFRCRSECPFQAKCITFKLS